MHIVQCLTGGYAVRLSDKPFECSRDRRDVRERLEIVLRCHLRVVFGRRGMGSAQLEAELCSQSERLSSAELDICHLRTQALAAFIELNEVNATADRGNYLAVYKFGGTSIRLRGNEDAIGGEVVAVSTRPEEAGGYRDCRVHDRRARLWRA